uniref:IS256 family transposase, variant Zn-binding type n=1 Tax=Lacinutrix jangbogonensis TaxID=1469557 RepID=UPI000A9637EF|nr:hypothetical protein [Lacinutrix jangbogonensis]
MDLYKVTIPERIPRKIVVLMDTTYWGRSFGLMLFKDAYTKENLLWYYVRSETNTLYLEGVNHLISRGYIIVAIVCDGRKGLLGLFKNLPVQLCQFHQVATIRPYITKNPKMPASIELKALVSLLKQNDKESFAGGLGLWFTKWECFLNERTTNLETGKSYYTHKRLRSAYRSLNTNIKWLFTWYDNFDQNIPNTTNMIDGHFSDLKNKLRNHNSLTKNRKIKFINEFLKG